MAALALLVVPDATADDAQHLRSVAIFPAQVAGGIDEPAAADADGLAATYTQNALPEVVVIRAAAVTAVLAEKTIDPLVCRSDPRCVANVGKLLDAEAVLTTVVRKTGGGRLRAELGLVHVESGSVLNQAAMPGRNWASLSPRMAAKTTRMVRSRYRKAEDGRANSEDSTMTRMLESYDALKEQLGGLNKPLDRLDRLDAFLKRWPQGRIVYNDARIKDMYRDVKKRRGDAEDELDAMPLIDYRVECVDVGESLPEEFDPGRKAYYRVIAPAPVPELALRRANEGCYFEHPDRGCGPCDILPGVYAPRQ